MVRFVTWSDGRIEVDEKCKYPQNRWMVEVEVCGSTPYYSIEHFLEHFVRTGTTGIALSLDKEEKRWDPLPKWPPSYIRRFAV